MRCLCPLCNGHTYLITGNLQKPGSVIENRSSTGTTQHTWKKSLREALSKKYMWMEIMVSNGTFPIMASTTLKKPTKLRVVFDCGTSLNEHVLPGPDMINNLTSTVQTASHCSYVWHRKNVSPVSCSKGWLQLSAPPVVERRRYEHAASATSNGTSFRRSVIPWLCKLYALKYLAKENNQSHSAGAQFITKDTRSKRNMCHHHIFVSNNHAVLQSIPPSECARNTKTKDLTFSDIPQERALGIHWCIEKNSFRFDNTLKDQSETRRGILSTVASIYDPLGFLPPYVLTGKRILQEMCRQGTCWDKPLPETLKPRWESWRHDFANLEKINIPRCYLPADFGKVVETELHHLRVPVDMVSALM